MIDSIQINLDYNISLRVSQVNTSKRYFRVHVAVQEKHIYPVVCWVVVKLVS